MNLVFAIGETVYDIIFDHDEPKAARAGGAMLNTAVSLGRKGLNVEMITELGNDRIGEMVLNFLRENGVSTSFTRPVKGFKTPVSLAFLDEQGNAHYSFYKNYPRERLNISWPSPASGDVVLFGSYYSLDPAVHSKIAGFIRSAKEAGALIVYDPNIRKNHLAEIRRLMPHLEENMALANIVRGSDEDFENLFGLNAGEMVFERLNQLSCKNLIYTCSDKGAEVFTEKIRFHVPAKKTEVISTIGAGDSFNAGIIYGLVKKGLTCVDLSQISEGDWKEIINDGIEFAAEVCGSYENYIKRQR